MDITSLIISANFRLIRRAQYPDLPLDEIDMTSYKALTVERLSEVTCDMLSAALLQRWPEKHERSKKTGEISPAIQEVSKRQGRSNRLSITFHYHFLLF